MQGKKGNGYKSMVSFGASAKDRPPPVPHAAQACSRWE